MALISVESLKEAPFLAVRVVRVVVMLIASEAQSNFAGVQVVPEK